MFGELIIMIVYLPILTLEGIEGKLFRPMALTVIFALVGSMVLSLTLMPVLASLLLPRKLAHRENIVVRALKRAYRPALEAALRARWVVVGVAVLLLANGVFLATQLGSEFVPRLREGTVVINTVRLASRLARRVRPLRHSRSSACCSRSSRTRSSGCGRGPAARRSPPIRWASSCPTCSSR